MRLKKKDIVEMVNNPEAKIPNPAEIKVASQDVQNLTRDIEKLNATMQDNMGSAFITKMSEDVNGSKSYIVQYGGEIDGENEFTINDVRWKYVWAKYPDGKRDIGVYRFGHDLVYDYEWFMDNVLPKPKKIQMEGDVDDFSSDYIDYMSDKNEKNKQDYDEWLNSPEGQEYMKSLDSLNESIKAKKVIKTIKVKDIK
jgi:hypothetical protein